MNIRLEFVTREIAGETLLVPVGKTALELNGMLTLNELGAFIWARLPEAEDEEALVQAVLEAYEVEPEQAGSDVSAFLGKLRSLGIL